MFCYKVSECDGGVNVIVIYVIESLDYGGVGKFKI